jgi:hypothetical protein
MQVLTTRTSYQEGTVRALSSASQTYVMSSNAKALILERHAVLMLIASKDYTVKLKTFGLSIRLALNLKTLMIPVLKIMNVKMTRSVGLPLKLIE